MALQPAPAGHGYDRFGGTPGTRRRRNDPLAYRQVPQLVTELGTGIGFRIKIALGLVGETMVGER